ncbi:cohesin domain-containing protein [Patescibacteria group bacterium]|nr:cohesin domain-containing protein [Patescibacteria group bacterium]
MDNFNTNVYNAPAPPPKKNFFGLKFSPKIIFIILGIVVLAEIIYAVRSLSQTPSTPPVSTPASTAQTVLTGGKISLQTSKTTVNVSEIIPVSVIIDSGGHMINGVDLIIKYDPKVLEVVSDGLIKGTMFDNYPLISSDADTGLISISGISEAQNGVKDAGQFATVNLKTKVAGTTSLMVDFEKDSTIDSNMVEVSTLNDILENVDNLEINIQ